jgi:hypothetical protein
MLLEDHSRRQSMGSKPSGAGEHGFGRRAHHITGTWPHQTIDRSQQSRLAGPWAAVRPGAVIAAIGSTLLRSTGMTSPVQ